MDEQRSNQPRSDYEANNQLEALRLIQEELWTTLRSEDDPDIRMALLARFAENRDTIADLTNRVACSPGPRESIAVAALAEPRPIAAIAQSSITQSPLTQSSIAQSSIATLEVPAVTPLSCVDEAEQLEDVIDLRDVAVSKDEEDVDLDFADADSPDEGDLVDEGDLAEGADLVDERDLTEGADLTDEGDLLDETRDPAPLPIAARSTKSEHCRLYELGTVALSHKPPSLLDDLVAFEKSHAAVGVLRPVARDRRGIQRPDDSGRANLAMTRPPPPTAEAWIGPPLTQGRTAASVGHKGTPSPLAHDDLPRKVILFMGGALAIVGMGWIYTSPDASTASSSAEVQGLASANSNVDKAAVSAVLDEISAVLRGVGLEQVVVADGDGVVLLSGVVASTGQRDAAIGVAEALGGEGLVDASALLVVAEGGDAAASLVVVDL